MEQQICRPLKFKIYINLLILLIGWTC